MTEYEAKNFLRNLDRYLLSTLGNKIADEVKGKIAEKLGLGGWWNLIQMDYPYKKVVDAIGMGFGLMSYYGFWIANGHLGLNPYDPKKPDQREDYVWYLLYSWAGGKPGYVYQFSKEGEQIKARANTAEAQLGRYGY